MVAFSPGLSNTFVCCLNSASVQMDTVYVGPHQNDAMDP